MEFVRTALLVILVHKSLKLRLTPIRKRSQVIAKNPAPDNTLTAILAKGSYSRQQE
jgi:hypothetical protein